MAITKILAIKPKNGYRNDASLKQVLRYIANPDKTREGHLVGGWNIGGWNWESAYEDMMATKKLEGKLDGRQGYHIIISFNPDEVTAETAYNVMMEFAQKWVGENYECLYSVHDDKKHIHGHLVFNSVNRNTGLKYVYHNGDWARYMQPIVNELCEKYGLETIDIDRGSSCGRIHYAEWTDGTRVITMPERMQILRDIIDKTIEDAEDIQEFIDILKNSDLKIRYGKYLSIRLPDWSKGIRTGSLGYAYTLDAIEKRIRREEITAPELPLVPEQPESKKEEATKIMRASYRRKGSKSHVKNSYYEHKQEINQFRKQQRERNYLMDHNINSANQLYDRLQAVQLKGMEIDNQRQQLFRQRRTYQDAITIICDKQLSPEERNDKLKSLGYNPDSMIKFEHDTAAARDTLFVEKRATLREQTLIRNILKDQMEVKEEKIKKPR